MRRRNMHYATGLPRWMRLGYSPGWVGHSPSGLGPCAEYLMTGQWPNPAMAADGQGMATPPTGPPDQQQRLASPQVQANLLEQRLQALREQIAGMDEQ